LSVSQFTRGINFLLTVILVVFWSWFPFGKAGIRTGLLFICAFAIFILRVAQLHVGLRTTRSGFETFKQYALRYQTIQTGIWYIFSAWLYSEIYIFSAPNSANIKWITDAKNAERPRLNERPIYLTTYFIFLAITQAGCHIYYDYDRIDLPVKKTKPEAGATTNAQVVTPPYVSLRAQLPSLAVSSIRRSLTMSIASPVIYLFTVREFVWSWTLMFAKLLWNLPKATSLPLVSPFHWTLLIRTWWGGAMLIMIWEVANAAFTLYVAQEPLKNERPLTYESRDPNGSLLTGLKGKKLQTRVRIISVKCSR
jgi:nucleoporin NDC1